MSREKNKAGLVFILFLFFTGTFLRLYNINFGLPHSFYADEPEVAELAIKYTYEFRDIFFNGNYYKLIPISFVYGTFPTYFYTITTIIFSKVMGMLSIGFEKMDLYIYMRVINAFLSLGVAIFTALLYYKMSKKHLWKGTILTLALVLLNWKFIVHAHYVNNDLFQTFFLLLSYLTAYKYLETKTDTKWTVLTGIMFGLALGTKITTLISLPFYIYLFVAQKKEFRNTVAFCFIVLATYMVTNPFSFVFATDFALRTLDMFTKEAGMVFDSVDSNPFKYVYALSYMLTLPILFISLYGKFKYFKDVKGKSQEKIFSIFLVGQIIIYLTFFSLQSRRVDRWLLPILPIFMIFATYGFFELLDNTKKFSKKLALAVFLMLSAGYYLYFPILLLNQFQRNTPKSAAYLWMQKNVPELSWKLVYTEEGLDPMNKLKFSDVKKFIVYTDESAQLFYPENPYMYDYVVLSSRPMENFKRPEVVNAYSNYANAWNNFEKTVLNAQNFELIAEFSLSKPNLIPLSDVYVYKNLRPAARPAPVAN